MHNVWLIAKREYTERIKTKGFLIATILIPLLMGGGLFGVLTMAAKSKTTSHIAVLTSQLQLADDLKQELAERQRQPDDGGHFVAADFAWAAGPGDGEQGAGRIPGGCAGEGCGAAADV